MHLDADESLPKAGGCNKLQVNPSQTPVQSALPELAVPMRRIFGSDGMVEEILGHPWVDSQLGPIEAWSNELVFAVNSMVNSKLICCLIWGPESVLLYNDHYKPLLGTKDRPLGRNFFDVWDEIRDQAAALLAGPWLTGESNIVHRVPFHILIDGNRVERICSLTNNPVRARTQHGFQTLGIVQTIIDHTDGVLSERELRKSQSELLQTLAEIQAIFDSGAVAAALIDAKTFRYLRVSPMLAELLNQPAEEIVGTSVFQLAGELNGLRAQLETVAAGNSLMGVVEEGELGNDPGEHRYWQSNYVPIRSPEGEVISIAAASLEVTHLKKAQAALIQNEKLAAMGRLAASIAHEINNPLESVTNLLYLARRTTDMDEIQDYLDTAEKELRRVAAITSQTLRFYKQSTSSLIVSGEDLFKSVLSIYQSRLLNSRISISSRNRVSRSVRCFDGEIRQVLNNLVGNAIDALHPEGGRLILRSREGTDWRSGAEGLVLTVADTAGGMSQHVKKKVFEAFYTTKGIGGTGLGLWVSKEIMDRHDGYLQVRSSQAVLSHGTVFTMFLPYEAVSR